MHHIFLQVFSIPAVSDFICNEKHSSFFLFLVGVYIYIYIYMVFTTEGFLEVAIESWPEWDLNPRPLNSVQNIYIYIYIYIYICMYI